MRSSAKRSATAPSRRRARSVKLTHPDRVYWPDAGVTKEGLAHYYAEVWRHMAPFIVGRPLALVRCPQGIAGQCFFQKHAWQGLSRSIQLARDPKDPEEALLAINDLDGLIGLVQAAVLEIHPWGASLPNLEQPDMIIMDLDPGEAVSWPEVIAAALEVRERLAALGLASFVKTSGGKGLHVVAPLQPKAAWPAVKAFTKSIADAMAADSPERFVATITKSKRRGKILVDYLRNGRGATAVAPYSTRARAGAPVSMPLAWDELGPGLGPAYFTVDNTPTRLAHLKTDPWADFRAAPPCRCPPRSCAGSEPPRLSPFQPFGRFPSEAMLRRSASMMLTTLLAGSGALFGLRDTLALLLGSDDLQQLLLHRVSHHLGIPGLGPLVDQLRHQPLQPRIDRAGLQVAEICLRIAHLVAISQGPQHDAPIPRHEHHGAFAAIENQPRDADRVGRRHGVADDREGLLADRIVRHQIVRPVVPDPADRIARHEHVDVDGAGALQSDRVRAPRPRAPRTRPSRSGSP